MRRLGIILLLLCVTVSYAQRRGRRAAPPVPPEEMTWELAPQFKKDVFTFARIRYESAWGREKWRTDWPDSDQNFSFRLQQLTSLKVNPEPVILELADPDLRNYPWIYFCEPGALIFSDDEVSLLRGYLLNGGFAMFDDFWGVDEYENLAAQLKRVFPEREPEPLTIAHPVFNCVFPLKDRLEAPPQVPNIYTGAQSEYTGVTWERPDAREANYRAIFDDTGRMLVIICHNTDLGDGWEREGESEYYFREFSEKKAYPVGINIVFYAMTH